MGIYGFPRICLFYYICSKQYYVFTVNIIFMQFAQIRG